MRLSDYEKETIILFNEAEDDAEIYTYNSELKDRLKKIASAFPEDVQLMNNHRSGGRTYRVSKRLIHISMPKSKHWKNAISSQAKEARRKPPEHRKME